MNSVILMCLCVVAAPVQIVCAALLLLRKGKYLDASCLCLHAESLRSKLCAGLHSSSCKRKSGLLQPEHVFHTKARYTRASFWFQSRYNAHRWHLQAYRTNMNYMIVSTSSLKTSIKLKYLSLSSNVCRHRPLILQYRISSLKHNHFYPV